MMTHALTFFFFNDTATTEIYTLSLHDALPISKSFPEAMVLKPRDGMLTHVSPLPDGGLPDSRRMSDRKSTRLNSSHANISYAVFCLKKKQHSTIISIHTSNTL